MSISIDINLGREEKKKLAGILDCKEADLDAALQPFARAAVEEYVRMFLGQRVFTRGSDMLEYRLFLLIKEAFEEQIPDEQDVCNLFQNTTGQSRSLIRAVMSKYQYELQTATDGSLKRIVQAAKQAKEGDDFEVTINSANIVEALNRTLAQIDGSLERVIKRPGSVSTYRITPASYARLSEHYGVKKS